jgi:hypothetical protein
LLESRTGVYIEWLDNELIVTANKILSWGRNASSAFLQNKITHKLNSLLCFLRVGNIFPIRVSLASTLYTQSLFILVADGAWGVDLMWRILLVGTDGSLYRYR